MIAFLFPGQGSQKRGMGGALFDDIREFAIVEREVDECLGYSVRKLCLEDPAGRLRETEYTQPCLYIVNALHYYKAISEGERPAFVAGHSVGEYNALLAAGAFDFLDGLRLVKKRGELMARARSGGMAAIIGLDSSRIAQLLRESGFSMLDIANYNSPLQTVLSGPTDDIQRAGPVFEKAGARLYMPLQVSGAFHSRYMTEASKAFANLLGSFSFHELKVPVISNVTAEPYPVEDATTTIRSLLEKQIAHPVLWTQSMSYLMSRGVSSFRELGPGTALGKLVQRIQEESGICMPAVR